MGLALFLRLWGVNFGLPTYIYHTDESLYAGFTLNLLDAQGNENLTRSDYPSLFYFILSFAFWLFFGISKLFRHLSQLNDIPLVNFVLLGRIISVAISTLTVYVTFRLAKTLFNYKVGLYNYIRTKLQFTKLKSD